MLKIIKSGIYTPLYWKENTPCVIYAKALYCPKSGKKTLSKLQVLPLDSGFNRSTKIPPLTLRIIPEYLLEKEASKTLNSFITRIRTTEQLDPIDRSKAFFLFKKWINFIVSKNSSRIYPIAYNWSEDKKIINDFFGYTKKGDPLMDEFFTDKFQRDICSIMSYLQDTAWANGANIPFYFNNPGLRSLCQIFKIPSFSKDNNYNKCMDILNVYKALINIRVSGELFEKRESLNSNTIEGAQLDGKEEI